MRNVERQASMRCATVTTESWRWSRGTCSKNVPVIPEEEELITFTGGSAASSDQQAQGSGYQHGPLRLAVNLMLN